jgi:hypothetical protein
MKKRVIFAIERRLRAAGRGLESPRVRYAAEGEIIVSEASGSVLISISPILDKLSQFLPSACPRMRMLSDVDVSPAIYRRPRRVISHRGIPMLKFSFGLELEVSSRDRRCACGNGPWRSGGRKQPRSAKKSELINLDPLRGSTRNDKLLRNRGYRTLSGTYSRGYRVSPIRLRDADLHSRPALVGSRFASRSSRRMNKIVGHYDSPDAAPGRLSVPVSLRARAQLRVTRCVRRARQGRRRFPGYVMSLAG